MAPDKGHLFHPIVLDAGGTRVNGRNRLRACGRSPASKPQFRHLAEHDDAKALIASANITRRNLKKSQQAIALAMIYPESTAVKGGRGNKDEGKTAATRGGFSDDRLREARVLRHSRALAEDVLADRTSLAAAVKQKAGRAAALIVGKMKDRTSIFPVDVLSLRCTARMGAGILRARGTDGLHRV